MKDKIKKKEITCKCGQKPETIKGKHCNSYHCPNCNEDWVDAMEYIRSKPVQFWIIYEKIIRGAELLSFFDSLIRKTKDRIFGLEEEPTKEIVESCPLRDEIDFCKEFGFICDIATSKCCGIRITHKKNKENEEKK